MKFNAIRFTKQDLISMPEDEQVFMLVAGNHLNSMNALMKQILFCSRAQTSNEVNRKAAEISAHVFIKYLAGEAFEGCEYLKRVYPAIKKQYESELSEKAETLWLNIEEYFSQPQNSLVKLRNNVGFHTNSKWTKRALAKMDEREPLAFYVTQCSLDPLPRFTTSSLSIKATALPNAGIRSAGFISNGRRSPTPPSAPPDARLRWRTPGP